MPARIGQILGDVIEGLFAVTVPRCRQVSACDGSRTDIGGNELPEPEEAEHQGVSPCDGSGHTGLGPSVSGPTTAQHTGL